MRRLRQPVVLGYIIAGLIVGPHVPIPLVADPDVVETLSELGVILLMFSLSLEFRLRKLMAHARPGEPARTHRRHRPGHHPDARRRPRADRGRAAASG